MDQESKERRQTKPDMSLFGETYGSCGVDTLEEALALADRIDREFQAQSIFFYVRRVTKIPDTYSTR